MSRNGKNVKFEESHVRAVCMRGRDIEQVWVFFFNEIKRRFYDQVFVLCIIEPFKRLVATLQ